jgi:hypothetical protein
MAPLHVFVAPTWLAHAQRLVRLSRYLEFHNHGIHCDICGVGVLETQPEQIQTTQKWQR